MKNAFFFFALWMGSMLFLSAQDYYLPVSTQSETAKKAYQAASYLGSNARFDAAREELKKALEADSKFFMAYAYSYQVLASNEQKADVLEQALAIDPTGFTEAEKITRGLLLAWKTDPKTSPAEAMKALTEAYPKTAEAFEWAYLHAFYTEKNAKTGFAYAQKFIAIDPNFPPVYNTLGYYYMGQKEMEKAKISFEKYLELAPSEPNAHDSMGEYYLTVKDYAKAAGYYDQAVALGMEASQAGADKAREAMANPTN